MFATDARTLILCKLPPRPVFPNFCVLLFIFATSSVNKDEYKAEMTSKSLSATGRSLYDPFLADRTIDRAFGTLCRLSVVVCDVLYCGKTVRPS